MSNGQPAGWYADPADSSQYRYWAGDRWTTHVRNRGEVDISSAEARPLPDFDADLESSEPSPQRGRSRRPVVAAAVLALVAIVATAGVVTSGSGDAGGNPLTGDVRVAAERVRGLDGSASAFLGDGARCGSGANGGIGQGTELTITNGRGDELATVELQPGRLDRTLTSTSCVFHYSVTGLNDAGSYVVLVNGRPAARASRAQLESAGWQLDARLD